jgi:hypothetical protein
MPKSGNAATSRSASTGARTCVLTRRCLTRACLTHVYRHILIATGVHHTASSASPMPALALATQASRTHHTASTGLLHCPHSPQPRR